MICLQTDQSKVKFLFCFFDVIVRLTGLEKTEILNRETYNTCTLAHKQTSLEQVIFSTQCSAVQAADCCRKSTKLLKNRAILKTVPVNKNEN